MTSIERPTYHESSQTQDPDSSCSTNVTLTNHIFQTCILLEEGVNRGLSTVERQGESPDT